METLNTAFMDYARRAMQITKSPTVVTEDNVFQEGSEEILSYLDKMVEALILPGSGFDGFENMENLYNKAREGKSCLLLLEHYSNLDLSLFSYLLRKAGSIGNEIYRSVVAIAGMKLTEDNPAVNAFASAYTRIVIYPSRSLQHLDSEKNRAELVRSNAINRAAMKALMSIKHRGRLILLFPSGTRFRPWDPSTKRGVREINSYIKTFDYMCLVAINGEILHVHEGDMMDDTVSKDVVRLTAGPVLSCREFHEKAVLKADTKKHDPESSGEGGNEASENNLPDLKQAVADAIMSELEIMHAQGEEKRKQFLP